MSRRANTRELTEHLLCLKDETAEGPIRRQLEGILELHPVTLRGYLNELDGEPEPHHQQVVAELVVRGAPTTRKAAVLAAERLWAPGYEALLIKRLDDEEDPAVKDAVIDVLGRRGGLASLQPLRRERVVSPLSRALRGAIRAVRERNAANEQVGAMSLIESGEGGQISVADGPGVGALSPPSRARPDAAAGGEGELEDEPEDEADAEAGERELAWTGALTRSAPNAPDKRDQTAWWAALSAAPRRVPLSLRWVSLSVGDRGIAALFWVFLGQLTMALVAVLAAVPWLALNGRSYSPRSWMMWALGLMLVAASGRWLRKSSAAKWRLLRDGVPTIARHIKQDERHKPRAHKTHQFRYHFDVMGEDGRSFRHTLPWRGRRLVLEDDGYEPVLYLPGADSTPELLRFCHELSWVRLDRRGHLRATAGGLLLAALVTAWVLLPVIFGLIATL